MTAGLCVCDAATVRAVSPDRCACGGAFYRESIAAASAEPPALSGEMWRDSFDGATWGIDALGCVHAWWPPAGLTWDAHPASAGEIARVLRAWAFAERARADRAEAAVAAFQRASGCADGVTLAVALRERNDLVRDLRDVAAGVTPHLMGGRCPDAFGSGNEPRDPDCDACHVLCRADAALVGSHRSDA